MFTKSHFSSDELYEYYSGVGYREPDVLRQLREDAQQLPSVIMELTPEQGQFITLCAKMLNAKSILDVGTFYGYSSIAMALALPDDGELITFDIRSDRTDVAEKYWKMAGISEKIKLRIGPAIESLDQLIADGRAGDFDMALVDADKESYDGYYERCLTLLRSGGCVLFDNMLSEGEKFLVCDKSNQSLHAKTVRALNQKIHDDERVDMCMLNI